jgi:hypothetical protein
MNRHKTSSKNFLSNKLFSILKIFLLFVVCILTSIILVWPFWKFSTALPSAYTIVVLSVIAIFLIYLTTKKILHSKKRSVIKVFVNLAVIFAGIFFTVFFVLTDKKLLSLLLFILTIVILTVFNILINRLAHD